MKRLRVKQRNSTSIPSLTHMQVIHVSQSAGNLKRAGIYWLRPQPMLMAERFLPLLLLLLLLFLIFLPFFFSFVVSLPPSLFLSSSPSSSLFLLLLLPPLFLLLLLLSPIQAFQACLNKTCLPGRGLIPLWPFAL